MELDLDIPSKDQQCISPLFVKVENRQHTPCLDIRDKEQGFGPNLFYLYSFRERDGTARL